MRIIYGDKATEKQQQQKREQQRNCFGSFPFFSFFLVVDLAPQEDEMISLADLDGMLAAPVKPVSSQQQAQRLVQLQSAKWVLFLQIFAAQCCRSEFGRFVELNHRCGEQCVCWRKCGHFEKAVGHRFAAATGRRAQKEEIGRRKTG